MAECSVLESAGASTQDFDLFRHDTQLFLNKRLQFGGRPRAAPRHRHAIRFECRRPRGVSRETPLVETGRAWSAV